MTTDGAGGVSPSLDDHGTDHSERKSRFRFKSKRRSHHDGRSRSPVEISSRGHQTRESRHHHRKRQSRAHSTAKNTDEPSLYDDTHLPNASSSQYLDPEAAFRESLFDAMADDEGAQFWEGVYGQPIHTYPDVKEGPSGELERMTDEEYTAFVRAKMYEKTHQHLIEEKARRDKARKERERLANEGAKEEREARKFQANVEESLRRGGERKKRRAWSEKWEAYSQRWEKLSKGGETVHIASIPWPTESGSRKDLDAKQIERFFLYASTGGRPTEGQLSKVLKLERIRWHPDKIQQKLGGQDVSGEVMQAVTGVFQTIDTMFNDLRDGKK